jgi:thiamine pyrophosphokinase
MNHVEGLMVFGFLQGTKIIDESQDQDTTDLHKCVAYIRDLIPNTDKSEVS